MSVKAKRLINDHARAMLDFLQTCVGTEYNIYPEVSLAGFCEQVNNLEYELRRFLFSSSSVDALITDSDSYPCLVVEFQSSYHDSAEAKERDRKKATLLKLAGVPLIYSRIYNVKLLHLYSEDEAIIHNLFTGEGREDAEAFVRKYCEHSTASNIQPSNLPF
ncbi:MAG: DUF2726 domain-containing protein [Limnoraphis sp. WC205]|jgi:Uma2 family endonuclease|nr:DUF2726 domain-containing protein [Limnoraphis sp. WC205]